MDFRSRRHERGSNWTDQEIVELLQLWSDESVQIELESSLRNQRVFDRIANILREKGIYRTGDQCREKIKKMKLEYRRIKDNHKMRSWKFYDVMDKVLANRPAITYSSLGGGVIAQQVFHSSGGPEPAQGGVPVGSFGPVSSGGFQFGQPPKIEDSLDIKCEDDADMLNSGDAPPEMYYCSGDDQETDGQSLLGPEDNVGRGESSANARISPSGFSDLNIANSASAVHQDVGGPEPQDPPKQPRKVHHLLTSARQKKRHRGGKAALNRRSAACSSQGRLEEALTRFLSWQQSAEERLLSMEEARLQRALQEEERREQREERRAERERQHELRLFSMLTGALVAVRQGAPTTVTTSNHVSHPAPSSSYFSQPSSGHPSVQNISAQEPTLPKSTKACEMAQKISATSEVAETPGCIMYLSHRGNSIRQQQGILQEGFIQYSMDKYHDTEKPDGIINLGTSENKLCYDVLHKRLTKDDMLHTDPSLLQYPDWRGHHFLREEVAKFLTDYCCSPKPLKAENVVVMNGCTSLFCSLAAVLCDPKDVILIPTPFYGAITEDMQLYSDVRLYHVHLEADGEDCRNFHLTVEKLEEGLKRAKQEGFNIRGVILMNPHNPLAEIYTTQEMIGFLEFAQRHKLHAIVDEVYMLSVFDDSVTFHSVLSVERLPDPQRTHVMWGMGKDFAMAGMRIGTLYTENRDLVEALAKIGSFHGIPGTTQHQVAQLLHDRDWINKEFLPENRRRLKAAHMCLASELTNMGIPYLHRPAALYIWADLRKYLGESSFERELSLWRCFLQHKVVVSCGQAFACSTPGWFRIVFADKDQHLRLGMKRFKEALKEFKEQGSTRSKDVSMEGKKSAKDSENAVIVKATSSPQRESCDQLKEKDNTVLHTELATDEFVLLDCQKSKPTEGLDSLIGTLRHQIRSSDWLEKNTPELSTGEDPEILDVFKVLLQRARK